MARREPSIVTASCGGEDGGCLAVREASSSVAVDLYATAPASMQSSPQSSRYVTADMSEQQIVAAIKKSRKQGWSELADGAQAAAAAGPSHAEDVLIWEELKRSDDLIFKDLRGDQLKLGRLIAEGGQAHIYEVSIHGIEGFVAKVFKMEGFSLADLKRQWPPATTNPDYSFGPQFVLGAEAFLFDDMTRTFIELGTFLEDGRFAFVMRRYWGDLRTHINLKLSHNNSQGPPFLCRQAQYIMHDIAEGMKSLHSRGVLHRDLKAANILVKTTGDHCLCFVADFESSMLVQGTGFWRAPEVLEELQKKASDRNAKIWTEKVDIYSYAMTCYEVLTGHVPFYGYLKCDWERVIDGERPHLPDYVDPKLGKLVERCWHKDPSNRPTFEVIVDELR